MMAKAATKTRITKKQVAEHRFKSVKDLSPKWDGHEAWNTDQFHRHFRLSMDYYRLEFNGRDLKPKVISWMSSSGYTKDQIKAFKDTKDFRCNSTMGSIAANLLKGMPPIRTDFNDGRNTAQWLGEQISKIIEDGKNDAEPEVVEEDKPAVPQITIQDRLREASYKMTEEIEDTLENFSQDPEAFDPKAFKILNLLKGKQAKAAHARIIRDIYQRQHDEYLEVLEGKCDQLKEGYSHLSKAHIKKISAFYNEILSACGMLMQEAKINKKPRAKKSVPAEKLVAKLKYSKTNEPLKLVSINPTDIIGAKELWIFNIKTRKLGKYIAGEFSDLGVKGTSITGFDEYKSVQKTLRKPEEQLKEFKAAGKVQLRKFLDDIKAVDIKLNGRINEDTILLKVQS
jgi:hypothetical protein